MKKKLPIPLKLIVMDALGAVLLGLEWLKCLPTPIWWPKAWQFEHYALVMIIFGVALMLPIITYILGGRKNNAAREI